MPYTSTGCPAPVCADVAEPPHVVSTHRGDRQAATDYTSCTSRARFRPYEATGVGI